MKVQTELESKVQEWLEEIKPVPARNPQAAARGRAQFLGQAVSASEFPRHKGWSSIFRKERFAMNMIVSILVIAGLLFGGGATVNAAQNDLPNEPLYGLKVWSEELGVRFQNDPEQKVERLMDLAQVRIQEMQRLNDADQAVPDQVRQRLQDHIQQALQICATMDDPALDRTLLQVRDRLQQQDRDMEHLHVAQNEQPILLQTRTMLQQRLQIVEAGLLNHEEFRNTVRNGFQFGQEKVTPPAENGNGYQNGQPTLVPVGPNTNPAGPNPAPTGSSYGPGEPNPDPGGPNPDAGGPNTSVTPGSTGGSGSGGNGSSGTGSGSGPGGGSGSGSGTGSGNGSGGTDTGGGGGGGGAGSGSGGQGGKP